VAGRVLVALGLAVAFSALWMTQFYPRQQGTGELTYVFRAHGWIGHGRQHHPRLRRDPPR
jgi:hypothetical protein